MQYSPEDILYETDKMEYLGEGVFGKRRHPREQVSIFCANGREWSDFSISLALLREWLSERSEFHASSINQRMSKNRGTEHVCTEDTYLLSRRLSSPFQNLYSFVHIFSLNLKLTVLFHHTSSSQNNSSNVFPST